MRNISGNVGVFDEVCWKERPGAYSAPFYISRIVADPLESGGSGMDAAVMALDVSMVNPVAPEIRPVNMAVRYLIRALP
jgi:hypothetical protein